MIEDNFTVGEGRPDTDPLPHSVDTNFTYDRSVTVHIEESKSNLASSPPLVEETIKFEHMKMTKSQKED